MAGRHRRGAAEAVTAPRIREADDKAGAFLRMGWSLAHEIGRDPGALAFVPALDQGWEDAKNVGYALANETFSLAEIARVTGTTRGAVHQRVQRGRPILARIRAEAEHTGKVRPIVSAPALRELRARALIDAGLEDTTAGPMQRQAYLRVVGE